MASGQEEIIQAALLALQASPALVPQRDSIRRAHRTAIPRDKMPAIHLIDGDDEMGAGGGRKCGKRRAGFTTSIFVRTDAAGGADRYKILVCERFKAAIWPHPSVMIEPPGRITIDTEIADLDATRVDIDWYATYETRGEWSLEFPE
jgi:hypothetical protein